MDAWLERFRGRIIVVLVALVAGGAGLLAGRQPAALTVAVATAAPTPTAIASIKVHVNGAVANPGVYTLRVGDRVGDAIAAAGGATPDGNANALNLAARLTDGQQVLVPWRGAPAFAPAAPGAAPPLVNINSASLAELDTLPGIGQAIGQKIIDHRSKNGPFQRLEDLRDLKLVPAATFDKIKDLLTL